MNNCIFCKIISAEINTDFVKESDNFVVIKDIKPIAETHLLFVSKKHLKDLSLMDNGMWDEIRGLSFDLQKELNLTEFQLRINWGELLEVNHLHFHFLSKFL